MKFGQKKGIFILLSLLIIPLLITPVALKLIFEKEHSVISLPDSKEGEDEKDKKQDKEMNTHRFNFLRELLNKTLTSNLIFLKRSPLYLEIISPPPDGLS